MNAPLTAANASRRPRIGLSPCIEPSPPGTRRNIAPFSGPKQNPIPPGYDESVSRVTEDPDLGYRDYEPIHPRGRDWRRIGRALAAPLIGVGFLLWKFKALVVALFKFKLFSVAGTMLISVAAYALLWGWKFAVGLVLLLLVHEMGHVLEARRQGLPTSAPMFIPFLGAFITMKQMPENVWREAPLAHAPQPRVGRLLPRRPVAAGHRRCGLRPPRAHSCRRDERDPHRERPLSAPPGNTAITSGPRSRGARAHPRPYQG